MDLTVFNNLMQILRERPDLFITALLLAYALSERSERKTQQKNNSDLIGKMHEQNSDTNELLTTIKVLLEVLTQGRIR